MKKFTCLLILSSVLFGCSPSEVDYNLVQDRGGIAYLPNESEPFTGTAVASYPSGQQQIVVSYENGKPSGISSEWYANGQMKSEQHFSGEDEGRIRDWYENGEVARDTRVLDGTLVGRNIWKSSDYSLEINVRDGLLNGRFFESYDDGNGFEEKQYANGILISKNSEFAGSEMAWVDEVAYKIDRDKSLATYSKFYTRFTDLNEATYTISQLNDSGSHIIKQTFDYSEGKDNLISSVESPAAEEWLNLDALTSRFVLNANSFELISAIDFQQKHSSYDLRTGYRNGLKWSQNVSSIGVQNYKDNLQHGWNRKFDRSEAVWEMPTSCYIEGEYEWDYRSDKKCGTTFGDPTIAPTNIHKDYIEVIQKDKRVAKKKRIAKEKEEERQRKLEEEKRKREEERRKQAELERKKQADAKRKLEKMKREEESRLKKIKDKKDQAVISGWLKAIELKDTGDFQGTNVSTFLKNSALKRNFGGKRFWLTENRDNILGLPALRLYQGAGLGIPEEIVEEIENSKTTDVFKKHQYENVTLRWKVSRIYGNPMASSRLTIEMYLNDYNN